MSEAEDRTLTPEERRQIIEMLRETAQGKRPSAGRDEVAGPMRLEIGGMHGRALECAASVRDAGPGAWAYRLVVGAGERADAREGARGGAHEGARGGAREDTRKGASEGAGDGANEGVIIVRMVQTGECGYAFGELVIDAPDRARGAAFADAMASWLGTPLGPGGPVAPVAPTSSIRGRWAKLGVRDDADGVRWDVYKLFVDAGAHAEVFLRVSPGAGRAAFTEKWGAYREPLLVGFERHLGAGRAAAPRARIDVFGGAWFTVPPDWLVARLAAHVRITDPADEAVLEISYQPFPLHPRLPSLPERIALAVGGLGACAGSVAVVDRGDCEYAWAEHEYEATDTKTGARRAARGRVLIAANDALQVLVTFSYWPADAGWAIPAFETILSTLRLAGRTPEVIELYADASLCAAPAG